MRKPSPAMIVALVALFVALSGVGVAANGGNFILGHANSATLSTALSAPVVGGKALQVTNTNTSNPASTALGLSVAAGHAPFTVNSAVKVANLNADLVDGLDSSALQQRVAGTCASGSAINGVNVNGSVTCQAVGGPALQWTDLTLANGWSGDCFVGGRNPQVAESAEGIVYFRGDMCTSGTTAVAFVLPAGFAPSANQWLVVDECNAKTGRLDITAAGQASVEGDPSTTFANSAGCFTSLDGVEFSP